MRHGPFAIGPVNGLMPCGPLQAVQICAIAAGGVRPRCPLDVRLPPWNDPPLVLGVGTAAGGMAWGAWSRPERPRRNNRAGDGAIGGRNAKAVLRDYDREVELEPGDNIVEFAPETPGTCSFSCRMGMVRGTVTVAAKGTAPGRVQAPCAPEGRTQHPTLSNEGIHHGTR